MNPATTAKEAMSLGILINKTVRYYKVLAEGKVEENEKTT